MALRTSSFNQLPMIQRSSSECVQRPWFIVWAQAEHKGNISLELDVYGRTGWYSFLGGKTLHFIIPSLSRQSGGAACTHIHFRVAYRKLSIFTNIRVQSNHIHIVNFFPRPNFVICFCYLSSTAYKASRIFSGKFFKQGCELSSFSRPEF